MASLSNKLKGGDLRSIGNVSTIIAEVSDQKKFDDLFEDLFHPERLIVMRTADAIEKITIAHPEYLESHKDKLLELLNTANHIELKWHLAQLMPRLILRLKLGEDETGMVWDKLTRWALDKTGSRIVRVNSIQALYDIQNQYPELKKDFTDTLAKLDRGNIPSMVARIKKLRNKK